MASKPIRQPELTEIQTFVLAVEYGSISAAAKRLRVSAAAATKRLNNLDVLSHGKLLERTSRGVQLTPLGQRILPAARRLVRDAELLLARPAERPDVALEGLHRVLQSASTRSTPEALRGELETLLACVFSGSIEPLLIANADGTVIDVNPAYCRLTGRERAGLVGWPIPGLEPLLPERSGEATVWSEQLKQEGGVTVPAQLEDRDGAVRTVGYLLNRIEIAQVSLVLIRVSEDGEP